jgi:hypothetical protein
MYICPSCSAQSGVSAPHGDGNPCPSAIALVAAKIEEKQAHTALLNAQTEATKAARKS